MNHIENRLDDLLWFCCACFATNEDGSWNHICDENYCYNCAHGIPVQLKRYNVESIRQQASWVGKRYYPNSEDKNIAIQLREARELGVEIGYWSAYEDYKLYKHDYPIPDHVVLDRVKRHVTKDVLKSFKHQYIKK